jgi:cytoskeletal protein CcmA (bactofilin family)
MFSKGNDNTKLESFIGKNSEFTGDINTKGTIRVDGKLNGNVIADWVLIGEKAQIKGNVNVGGLVVGGTVEGNVNAKEVAEIKQKGIIKGDIVTSKLLVIEGGILEGRISMLKDGSKVIELDQEKFKEASQSQ